MELLATTHRARATLLRTMSAVSCLPIALIFLHQPRRRSYYSLLSVTFGVLGSSSTTTAAFGDDCFEDEYLTEQCCRLTFKRGLTGGRGGAVGGYETARVSHLPTRHTRKKLIGQRNLPEFCKCPMHLIIFSKQKKTNIDAPHGIMLSLGALPVGVDCGSRVFVHVRVLSFRGLGRGRDPPRED